MVVWGVRGSGGGVGSEGFSEVGWGFTMETVMGVKEDLLLDAEVLEPPLSPLSGLSRMK